MTDSSRGAGGHDRHCRAGEERIPAGGDGVEQLAEYPVGQTLIRS